MVPETDGHETPFHEHLRAPRNSGCISEPDGIGLAENPVCGDQLRVTIRVDSGIVQEARFEATGCAATLAAGSVVTELLRGLAVTAVSNTITTERIDSALGTLPPLRRHAASLASAAANRAALDALGAHPSR